MLCSYPADQCCLCSTPRIYLCQACTGRHTSSTQACHSLLPASTPTYVTQDNLVEYNRKTTALKKLTEQLEIARARLSEERRALDQVFNEVYTQQVKRLYDACSAVYADICRYYERLQTDVDAFNQELSKAAQNPYISHITRMYIEAGFHVPPSCIFFDALEEMNSRIQVMAMDGYLNTQNCLLKVAGQWRSVPCRCPDCCEIKDVLACQSPSGSSQGCAKGRSWSQPRHASVLQAEVQRGAVQASPYSTCLNCGYEYNITEACVKCGLLLQGSMISPQVDRFQPSGAGEHPRFMGYRVPECSPTSVSLSIEPPARHANPPIGHWKCRYCGDDYQFNSKCSKCENKKTEKAWMCFGCGNRTAICYDFCSKCNAPKDLGLYLVSREVELTETRQQWVCKCKAVTPIYLLACCSCRRENKKVRDALGFNGNYVRVEERIGKIFS